MTSRLWEFHQIYNFGMVGDKDELFMTRPNMVKKSYKLLLRIAPN